MLALLGTAFAADILFFYDDPSSSSTETSDLIDALEDAGHTVTEVNENSWSNSPAVSGFDVVIHQNGANNYGIDMPTAGQTALASWVEAGGGYIGTAWASWEEDNRSHYASMSDLILLDHSNDH